MAAEVGPAAELGATLEHTNEIRIGSRAKVAGAEAYSADLAPAGSLLAGVKRAGMAHARLLGVNTAAAARVAGVRAVLTSHDVQGPNRQGVAQHDQPVLVDDKVRHHGDAVALVLAEDRAALQEALALIELEVQPLEGVFDMDQALAPGAVLIHENHPFGNALLKAEITVGRGEAALAGCPVVLEGSFEVPRQEHAYLETECGWAILDEQSRITITCSTQTPFRDRAEVAMALGLESERLRVVVPQTGGAFGGKDGVSVQSLLALAALACPGRAVKMQLTREESFISSPKRHPARLHYRLGSDNQGRLKALDARLVYDTGPYDHLGGVVMALGLEHAGGPYRIPNTHLAGWAVYTNNPVSGAFRGFGIPQAAAAMETMMDRLARHLGLDPIELRRRNILRHGDETPIGCTLECSAEQDACLDLLQGHALWAEREAWKQAAPPFKLRGVGLAMAMHGMGYGPVIPDVAEAKLELTEAGGLKLYNGVVDMGQGNGTTFVRLAAALLSQEQADIELISPDTDRTLNCGSSSASRTTFTYGNALIEAAKNLKQRMLDAAAGLLGRPVGELSLGPGLVRHAESGAEASLARVAEALNVEERTVTHKYQAPTSDQRPSEDPAVTMHGLPHKIFSFGAQLVGVEVDRLTGRVEVKHLVTACDVGRVNEPRLLEQQLQGGAAQGLGYALWEDMPSREGRIETMDFSTYILPTSLDLPDMESHAVEGFEPEGPKGMKGAGELPCDIPAPAMGAAMADACGWSPSRWPISAEAVLAALAEREGEARP